MDKQTPKVYMVRADFALYAPAFLQGGYAGIGWFDDTDLSTIPDEGKDALRILYADYEPEASTMRLAQNVGQIWRFVTELQEGDYVVTPSPNGDSKLCVGQVTGSYYYEPEATDSPYPHRKPVKWFSNQIKRSSLSIPAQHTIGAALTIFEIRQIEEILAPFGVDLPERVKRLLSTEDEINRAILDQLLELSADEFEIFVTELLIAIGFEAEHVGQPGDGGIDVTGKLRVYEFATVDLMVQVKRYASGKISHNDIKHFRSSVPEKTQAAFVTTSDFTSKARNEAEKLGFKKIGLINGAQLVDILVEHYDDLSEEIHDKLNLRKTLIPGTT